MTIAEAREKCKSLIAKIPRDVLVIAVLLLASSASFWLGYLAGIDAGQVTGSANSLQGVIAPEESPTDVSIFASTTGKIVASRNGTKYYLPNCSGADRISNANKVWFVSVAAAVAAGYAPAANCKGL